MPPNFLGFIRFLPLLLARQMAAPRERIAR
jgi:hypothetical protein